ncbi:MAG: hypothetical protein E2P02_08045 [Acidobacteria bacterium]|nr:MAG: hypothetical protein E2P02_08045 [Acidobacteriota bacterium]
MLKIWRFAFQRRPVEEEAGSTPAPTSYPAAALVTVALIVALSLAAGPIFRYSFAAAEQLLDVSRSASLLRGGR